MTVRLTVDAAAWRRHVESFAAAVDGLVPVVKGNGYGFTVGRLARKAAWLGVDTLAVGTYDELDSVAHRFEGDLLVLTLGVNSGSTTVSNPGGWTRADQAATSGLTSVIWTRTATADDPGSTVTVTTGAFTRDAMLLGAYLCVLVAPAR